MFVIIMFNINFCIFLSLCLNFTTLNVKRFKMGRHNNAFIVKSLTGSHRVFPGQFDFGSARLRSALLGVFSSRPPPERSEMRTGPRGVWCFGVGQAGRNGPEPEPSRSTERQAARTRGPASFYEGWRAERPQRHREEPGCGALLAAAAAAGWRTD